MTRKWKGEESRAESKNETRVESEERAESGGSASARTKAKTKLKTNPPSLPLDFFGKAQMASRGITVPTFFPESLCRPKDTREGADKVLEKEQGVRACVSLACGFLFAFLPLPFWRRAQCGQSYAASDARRSAVSRRIYIQERTGPGVCRGSYGTGGGKGWTRFGLQGLWHQEAGRWRKRARETYV